MSHLTDMLMDKYSHFVWRDNYDNFRDFDEIKQKAILDAQLQEAKAAVSLKSWEPARLQVLTWKASAVVEYWFLAIRNKFTKES